MSWIGTVNEELAILKKLLYKNSNTHINTQYLSALQGLKKSLQSLVDNSDASGDDASYLTDHLTMIRRRSINAYQLLRSNLMEFGFFVPFASVSMGLCARCFSLAELALAEIAKVDMSDMKTSAKDDFDLGQVVSADTKADIVESSLACVKRKSSSASGMKAKKKHRQEMASDEIDDLFVHL
jgi:hypothetical protein